MSFNGQRGPTVNMNEFIGSLNTIEPQDTTTDFNNFLNSEEDLAMFSASTFFDFDQGQTVNAQPSNFDFSSNSEPKGLDFMNEADFSSFPDFNFAAQPANGFQAPIAPLQTIQPIYPTSSSTGSPENSLSSPQVGEKRKASSAAETPYPTNYDEDARVAAEEDKRRRNTAASARFRVKKKQREQALEKSAKEMADKMSAFEEKIKRLETENKWLKSLVLEKKDKAGEKEIELMYQKHQQDEAERKASERKDGVGTVKSEA